jgi:hypothetical protein
MASQKVREVCEVCWECTSGSGYRLRRGARQVGCGKRRRPGSGVLYAYPYPNCDRYGHANGDSHVDQHADNNPYVYSPAYVDSHAYGDANRDCSAYSGPAGDGHAITDAHPHADTPLCGPGLN